MMKVLLGVETRIPRLNQPARVVEERSTFLHIRRKSCHRARSKYGARKSLDWSRYAAARCFASEARLAGSPSSAPLNRPRRRPEPTTSPATLVAVHDRRDSTAVSVVQLAKLS